MWRHCSVLRSPACSVLDDSCLFSGVLLPLAAAAVAALSPSRFCTFSPSANRWRHKHRCRIKKAPSPAGSSMSTALESYINRTVAIVTSDGRMIVGTLKGFDQTINLILDESHERVFSSSQGVEQVVLGLYIVRGDNVAVIGEIDEETDSTLDLGNIRAEPLNSVVH
ncbi:LSM8 homolog, U6 small nuclear RNA associated [Thunnus thynnus]